MAISISGECKLSATREFVCDLVSDSDVLRSCLPNCENFCRTRDMLFETVMPVTLGPLKAKFRFTIHITSVDQQRGCHFAIHLDGKTLGFIRGFGDATIVDTAGGSMLAYKADIRIKGEIAELGTDTARIAIEIAADDFLTRLGEAVQVASESRNGAAPSADEKAASQVSASSRPISGKQERER